MREFQKQYVTNIIQTIIIVPTFGLFLLNMCQLNYVKEQLDQNIANNRISITGHLYDRETQLALDEEGDPDKILSTIWALVPPQVTEQDYVTTLLGLVTKDQISLRSKNAAELYHSMFDAEAFESLRLAETHNLRRLFTYTQNSFYHLHQALDYVDEGIMVDNEWRTWKGLIRDMHTHPMLLTVIWQGYQNKYFSRTFARFLQSELCSDAIPSDITPHTEHEAYFVRGRDFIKYFYPEMTEPDWPDALPDYSPTKDSPNISCTGSTSKGLKALSKSS